MSILLKFPFSSYGQKDIYLALSNAKDELKKNIEKYKTNNDIDLPYIEDFLNELYYGKTPLGDNSLIEEYNRILQEEAAKNIEKKVEDLDLRTEKSSYKHKASGKSVTTKYYDKLNRNLESLDIAINNIQDKKNRNKLKSLKRRIENLLKEVKIFLSESDDKLTKRIVKNFIYEGSSGTKAAELVKKMDIYNSIINSGKNMDVLKVGNAFEESLKEAFQMFYGDSLLGVIRTGGDLVSRGVYQGQKMDSISYSIDFDNLEDVLKDEIKESQGFSHKDGNYTYTYHPGQEKQGKMDVQAVYNTGELRISAKSWTHGSNIIGETSIAAGLTRAVGPNIMKYYTLSLLDPSKDYWDKKEKNVRWESANIGHELARLGLLSDIVMGLNQDQAGRAEILVIDTGEKILVRDVSHVIDLLQKAKRITWYDEHKEDKIKSEALRMYNNMKQVPQGHRSETYFGLTTISVLDKMKVSINLTKEALNGE